MNNEILVGIEIDFRGEDGEFSSLSNLGLNFENGFFRAITGVQNKVLDGSLFRTGLISSIGSLNQRIDISEGGNYSTFNTFTAKFINSTGLSEFLRVNDIFPEGCKARIFSVVDNVQYLLWSGNVYETDSDESFLSISFIDDSLFLHKNIPSKKVNAVDFGLRNFEEQSSEFIPVSIGKIPEASLVKVSEKENILRNWVFSSNSNLYEQSSSISMIYGINFSKANSIEKDFSKPVVFCASSVLENQFAGAYLRISSGDGKGEVYKVLLNSSSFQLGTDFNGISIFGCTLQLDKELQTNLSDPSETIDLNQIPLYSESVEYNQNDFVFYKGEVFKKLNSNSNLDQSPALSNDFSSIASKTLAIKTFHKDSFVYIPSTSTSILDYSEDKSTIKSGVQLFKREVYLIASENPVYLFGKGYLGLEAGEADSRFKINSINGRTSDLKNGLYSGFYLSDVDFVSDSEILVKNSILKPSNLFYQFGYQGATDTGSKNLLYSDSSRLSYSIASINDENFDSLQVFDSSFVDSSGTSYSGNPFSPITYTGTDSNTAKRTIQLASKVKFNLNDFPEDSFDEIIPNVYFDVKAEVESGKQVEYLMYFSISMFNSVGFNQFYLPKQEFRRQFKTSGTSYSKTFSIVDYLKKGVEQIYSDALEAFNISNMINAGSEQLFDSVEIEILIVSTHESKLNDQVQFSLQIREASLIAEAKVRAKDFSVSMFGEIWGSFANGRYSSSDYVENIPEALEYIFRAKDLNSNIDENSIDVLRASIPFNDSNFGTQFLVQKSSRNYVIDILKYSLIGCYSGSDGKKFFKHWLSDSVVLKSFSTETNIIDNSMKPIEVLPTSSVYSIGNLNFNYSEVQKKFLSSISIQKTDESSFPAYSDYDSIFTASGIFADQTQLTSKNWASGGFLSINFFVPDDGFDYYEGDLGKVDFVQGGFLVGTIISIFPSGSGFILSLSVDEYFGFVDYQLQTASSFSIVKNPSWFDYASGFRKDQYSTAKRIWEKFRQGYKRTKKFNSLPSAISDNKFIKTFGENQANETAIKFLELAIDWLNFQKRMIEFDIPFKDSIDLNLLSYVSVYDSLIVPVQKNGWVVEISKKPMQGICTLKVIFEKDRQDLIENIIDEGFDGVQNINIINELIDPQSPIDIIDEGVV